MIRLPVDFNNMTEDRKRVQINKPSFEGLPRGLYPGERVILYTPGDFEVEGTIEVETDERGEWWYGVIDWATTHDLDEQNNR
jgi:hypothetical protein